MDRGSSNPGPQDDAATEEAAREPSRETATPRSILTRSTTLRVLLFVAVPGALVALLAWGLLLRAGPKDLEGKLAPGFSLPVLGSNEVLSDKHLRGSPVVVNFWASWCIPCREEAPILEQAWVKYRGEGVKFLGVNVQDSTTDALEFVDQFQITFPSVRDVELVLWREFGVRGVPETFFIDHRYRFLGSGSGEQIGARGSVKILGAIKGPVLESRIRQMLELQSQDGG